MGNELFSVIWVDGVNRLYQNGHLHKADGSMLCDVSLSKEFHNKLVHGDIKDLPMYLGLCFDEYITERLSNGTY